MAIKTDTLVVDPRQVRNLLFRIIAFLVVLGTAVSLSKVAAGGDLGVDDLGARFELHTENSLPAWFSSLLLVASAPLFAVLAKRSREEGHSRDALAWTGLALLMLAMSIDEMASFHEYAGEVIGIEILGFSGAHNWLVFGFTFVVVFGLAYAPFVMRLPAKLRGGLILGAAVFFGGAVGVETMEAFVAKSSIGPTYEFVLLVTIEETMEMLGSTLILYALLTYLHRNDWSVTFRFPESVAHNESHGQTPPTIGGSTPPSDQLP